MKVIRNKFVRLAIYILGFLCVLGASASAVAFGFKYGFFPAEKSMKSCYEESDTVKNGIYRELVQLQDKARAEKAVYDLNILDKELEIVDYSDISEKVNESTGNIKSAKAEKVGVDEILGDSAYSQLADYVSPSGGGSNSMYTSYENMQYPKDGKYIRLTWADYMNIVRNNCEKFNGEEYWGYEEREENGEISAEDYDLFEQLSDQFPEEGIGDKDYYTFIDNKLYLYRPGDGLISYADYGTTQVPYDLPMNDYIYFPYSEDLESIKDQKALDEYILKGYIYRTGAEAVYASLSSSERAELTDNSAPHDYYSFEANAAYSIDGKTVADSYIYDYEKISSINKTSGKGYNVSYEELCRIYETNSDIFISYDAESGKVTQWYKDATGTKVPYEYLTADNIGALTNGINEDFIICINDSDESCYNTWVKNAYNYTRYFSDPAISLAVSFVIFLICVVLLIIGEPAKMYKVDRAPYVVWLLLYGTLISAFGLIFSGIEYSISITRAVNSDVNGVMAGVALSLLILYLSTAAVIMNLVRRVKCDKFLDGFLVIKVARWIKKKFNSVMDRVPGNGRLVALVSAYLFILIVCLIGLCSLSYTGEAAFVALFLIAITGIFVFFIFRYMTDVRKLLETSRRIEAGELDAKVNTLDLRFNAKELGESLNNLGAGLSQAVESSLRDERTKAELITNVSHDIKTPLTSIINYVDLLKKEEINNDKATEYINVLDQKSQRLKQLILDLIEASKTSTGNIELECMNMNLVELINQGLGEYEDKFSEAGLDVIKNFKVDSAVINADGRRVFRIIDNVLNNVVKYAQKGTRVYMDLDADDSNMVKLSLKNISRESLNISPKELTERFVRGDRSRNTEGSGLGLSIAKNLTELQKGKFDITIDGDLFKVEIAFPLIKPVVKGNEESKAEDGMTESGMAESSLTEDRKIEEKRAEDNKNQNGVTENSMLECGMTEEGVNLDKKA